MVYSQDVPQYQHLLGSLETFVIRLASVLVLNKLYFVTVSPKGFYFCFYFSGSLKVWFEELEMNKHRNLHHWIKKKLYLFLSAVACLSAGFFFFFLVPLFFIWKEEFLANLQVYKVSTPPKKYRWGTYIYDMKQSVYLQQR